MENYKEYKKKISKYKNQRKLAYVYSKYILENTINFFQKYLLSVVKYI